METPSPSLREQGMQALQEGNFDKAIDLLARAVMADDKDADAKALLGITYSQKGLHAQAKRALETAVSVQPQNPNFRFNLGVVLERAGDLGGAALAYKDALTINPQHAQAKAKLQAMGPQAQQLINTTQRSPHVPVPNPGGVAPSAAAPPPPPGYGAPAPGMPPPQPPMGGAPMGGPPLGAPPMGGAPLGGAPIPPPPGAPMPGAGYGAPIQPPPGYGAPPPMGAPQMGMPPMGAPPMGGAPMMPGAGGPPGTIQCPSCARFSKVGMICEFCSQPLPPPPRPMAPPPTQMGGHPGGFYRPVAAKPHRGGLILTLSIFGFCCVITAILAWVFGNGDLKEMDAGIMDDSGRGMTSTGRIIGIVMCGLHVIGWIIQIAIVVGGHR